MKIYIRKISGQWICRLIDPQSFSYVGEYATWQEALQRGLVAYRFAQTPAILAVHKICYDI